MVWFVSTDLCPEGIGRFFLPGLRWAYASLNNFITKHRGLHLDPNRYKVIEDSGRGTYRRAQGDSKLKHQLVIIEEEVGEVHR
jgi:hypothetical protein